jgi:methionyl-tRNA formyltransferase
MSKTGSMKELKNKTVVVLGKGSLAIKIADYFNSAEEFNLLGIIPVLPEPEWSDSFISWAVNRNVEILNFENLTSSKQSIDLGFSCYFDKILGEKEIEVFSTILNLHNAPLPKYRGVNPINWALKNNEKEHGVTIHAISTGIDDGPIFGQVKFKIDAAREEVTDVYDRSLHFGYALFEDVIKNLDKIFPQEQEHHLSTYFSRSDFKELGDRKGFTRESP